MFKKSYIDSLKNDEELQELRREYHELTGKTPSMDVRKPLSAEEWKAEIRRNIEELKN